MNRHARSRESKLRDYLNHRDAYLERARKSRARQDKETSKEYYRNYFCERAKRDPRFHASTRLHARLYKFVKGLGGRSTFPEICGCSDAELRAWLEAKFEPGMSWDNHGSAWEIDHAIPRCRFDLTKADQQRECFHYTNLRPLWAEQNKHVIHESL